MSGLKEPQAYRILVHAIETKALQAPKHSIGSKKYTLVFAQHKDGTRFQDFDGVILFQGTFESFERCRKGYRSYTEHFCDRDELDKRTKEVLALIEKGGIVCMLLTDPFIDFDDRSDFRETDISKRLLSGFEVQREQFRARTPNVSSKVNELGKFFKLYGAAWAGWSSGYGVKG